MARKASGDIDSPSIVSPKDQNHMMASGDIDTPSIVSSRDQNHPSNFMYGRRLHVQRLSPSIVYIVNRIFWRVPYTYRVVTVKNVEDVAAWP